MGGASGLPSSRPPEQDLKILCVRVAPSENCEDKPAGASWHSGTPMTQSKADAMISTPSPTMTSPPIVRSATSRVEEPASHSPRRSCDQAPRAVRENGEEAENDSERQQLPGHVSRRAIDEMGEHGHEEDERLGIESADDKTLLDDS